MSRIGSDDDGSTRCQGGPVLFFAIEIDPVQVDRFLRDGLNGELDGDRTVLRFFGTLDMGGGGAGDNDISRNLLTTIIILHRSWKSLRMRVGLSMQRV